MHGGYELILAIILPNGEARIQKNSSFVRSNLAGQVSHSTASTSELNMPFITCSTGVLLSNSLTFSGQAGDTWPRFQRFLHDAKTGPSLEQDLGTSEDLVVMTSCEATDTRPRVGLRRPEPDSASAD